MDTFDQAVARYASDLRVTLGTGFGSAPARRVDGRIFAMLIDGDLVVKLPAARVTQLVDAGLAVHFDAGKGRPMREWARIGPVEGSTWTGLVDEAYAFVRSR